MRRRGPPRCEDTRRQADACPALERRAGISSRCPAQVVKLMVRADRPGLELGDHGSQVAYLGRRGVVRSESALRPLTILP